MTGVPAPPPDSETPLLREVLRHAEALLREAGVDTPELDARLLMGPPWHDPRAHADPCDGPAQPGAGYPRAGLHRPPGGARTGFPILGRREFWSLDFHLSPATLDPRPDSETVIEEALAGFPDKRPGLRPRSRHWNRLPAAGPAERTAERHRDRRRKSEEAVARRRPTPAALAWASAPASPSETGNRADRMPSIL